MTQFRIIYDPNKRFGEDHAVQIKRPWGWVFIDAVYYSYLKEYYHYGWGVGRWNSKELAEETMKYVTEQRNGRIFGKDKPGRKSFYVVAYGNS